MFIALLFLSLVNIILLVFLLKNQNQSKAHFELVAKLNEQNTQLIALNSTFENSQKNQREDAVLIKDSITKSAQDSRSELKDSIKDFKEELAKTLKESSEALTNHVRDLTKAQKEQLASFAEALKGFGDNNYKQLKNLQESNEKKLEEMRLTVDEKLQSTLEKRLDSSFKQVSERLEKVHAGLGEMQNLATGVGDLKKVLTNVKTRGTWGEVQLANLLEDIMSPEQYQANVGIKAKSQERVDFAIKLPGNSDTAEVVWLPIDSKFPQEDYQKLVDANEISDPVAAELASKQLENRIKLEAKSISEKYIDPPQTTDFALLFLPTEGLYAEVLRMPGLVDFVQRKHRVNLVGPTTLAALLNSLQLGFKTLTIQKRTSEVWHLLSDIKKHFGSFGDLLEKAHDKVGQATKVIEDAGKRSRTIEAKLRKVESIQGPTSTNIQAIASSNLN
jgi:DNA recombination protein RmuC